MPAENRRQLKFKNTGLTYSRCPLDFDDFLVSFKALAPFPSCTSWLVAQEHHQDGGLHYHCFLQFPTDYRTRNTGCFDIQGWGGQIYHPNFQTIRDIKAWIDYCKKEGGLCAEDTSQLRLPRTRAPKKTYLDVREASATKEEYLANMEREFSRDFVLYRDKIIAYADFSYAPPEVIYEPTYTEFNIPDALSEWVSESLVSLKIIFSSLRSG